MTERQDIRRLQQGLRRVKGASGADGTDGIDGVDGATGPTGSTGPVGADGADGATGPAGVDGADGEGVALGGTANQALTKIDGVDFNTDWSTIDNSFVGSEPADNTILKDADISGSVQAFSSNLDTYAANSLTADELGELQNINTVTITNAQWAFLGAFDQGLTTESNVTFGTGAFSGTLTGRDSLFLRRIPNSSTQTGIFAFHGTVLDRGFTIVSNAGSGSFPIGAALNVVIANNRGGALGNIIFATDYGTTPTEILRLQGDTLAAEFVGSIVTAGNLTVNSGGEVFLNLPTSAGTAGSLWNDAGTVKEA